VIQAVTTRYPFLSILGIIVIFTATCVFAQGPDTVWTRTYGGTRVDRAYWVDETADGGFIVVGETDSPAFAPRDVYLLKTDANGDTLWKRYYGGDDSDYGRAVFQTFPDSGYMVIGTTYSFGPGRDDVYMIKTDTEGDTLWTKTYGVVGVHDHANSAQQTADGGYIIAGDKIHVWSGQGHDYDIYLVRTDAGGDTLWTRVFGTRTTHDFGYSVQELADGNYIVGGYYGPEDESDYDIFLMKVSAEGESLWTRTYGGTGQDYGYSVALSDDGGFVIAGHTSSYGTPFVDRYDLYLIGTDAEGDTLWTRTFGGPENDYGYSVQAIPGGGYIVAGETFSFGEGQSDIFLIKTDDAGNRVWSRTFGSSGLDGVRCVKPTGDSCFILAGRTRSFGNGDYDVYMLKVSDDLVPPELVAGMLLNPYMTQYLDVCLIGSEALDPSTIEIEVNGDPASTRLIDPDENVWVGDFKVLAPGGVHSIECRASDLGGNGAGVVADFSVTLVLAGDGGRVLSPDGRACLILDPGVVSRNTYITVLPCMDRGGTPAGTRKRSAGGPVLLAPAGESPSGYYFGPSGSLNGGETTVEFYYDASDLGPDGSADQLVIVNDRAGRLDSYFDPATRTVSATTSRLGSFQLVLGGPGASRLADKHFLNLAGGFPSPFRESTTIRYEIRSRQHHLVAVYDVLGREVVRLLDRTAYPGVCEVEWDGRSASGNPVSSGLYFVKIQTEHTAGTCKVTLTR
jgi:hypothetical protein